MSLPSVDRGMVSREVERMPRGGEASARFASRRCQKLSH